MSDWKYDIDEVGEDADSAEQEAPARGPDVGGQNAPESGPDERGRDERERGPLEPGSPTVENALFVTLGVATMLFLFARVIVVAGG